MASTDELSKIKFFLNSDLFPIAQKGTFLLNQKKEKSFDLARFEKH